MQDDYSKILEITAESIRSAKKLTEANFPIFAQIESNRAEIEKSNPELLAKFDKSMKQLKNAKKDLKKWQ